MNPVAEIITIGDEILIGQTIDTNSAWIGGQMSQIGLPVKRIISISDSPEEIVSALDDSLKRAQVVLVTGGLGPTSDDRTKQTLAGYFGSRLVMNQEVLDNIMGLFKLRNFQVTPRNRDQALVPDNCRVLRNPEGTAPGMWFEKEGRVVVSMPGVPFEMKAIMNTSVLELLKERFRTPVIVHRTIMTSGLGESFLAELISGWEDKLPDGYSLAYLPSPGLVRLRITGTGHNRDELVRELDRLTEEVVAIIPSHYYGLDDVSLEEVVGNLLRERRLTVSLAESCTGGNLAALITRIPGSSDYFTGGVVAYANEVKIRDLEVPETLLAEHGAVSRQVVEQMAIGCRSRFGTDYSIATSGIAGPGGGTPDKPVGTVWIAVAGKNGVVPVLLKLGEHRERNITRASLAALNLLRTEVMKVAIGS